MSSDFYERPAAKAPPIVVFIPHVIKKRSNEIYKPETKEVKEEYWFS